MTAALFELGGALADALPALAIGPWTRAAPDNAAYSVGADPSRPGDAAASLWRVDLARNAAISGVALDRGAHSVARVHAALDDVPDRFDHMIASGLPALPGPATLTRPDAEFPATPGERNGLSFAASLATPDDDRLAQTLLRVADLLRGRARIETRIDGVLVACSISTLSGDTELWISPRLSLTAAELHARSVAVAVRTRDAWLRILAMIVVYGTKLAALGFGSIAALPVVWRLLSDVLREARTAIRFAPSIKAM
ncbi:MAG TPA: hypothetical protein VH165_34325 [Kofleriaceae bacterium]|jgi:hypothetical protein|nr:hypothetical protein [Kofleriaceae bacterium]